MSASCQHAHAHANNRFQTKLFGWHLVMCLESVELKNARMSSHAPVIELQHKRVSNMQHAVWAVVKILWALWPKSRYCRKAAHCIARFYGLGASCRAAARFACTRSKNSCILNTIALSSCRARTALAVTSAIIYTNTNCIILCPAPLLQLN